MRIDVHRTFIIAVCSWALAASPVRADVTRFDLAGIVRDTTGAVLPGVTVSVKNVDTGFTRSTVTDSEGRYSFTALPPTGKWTITAELQGFQTQVRQGMEFQANTKPELHFQLGVGNLQEAVIVQATAPLVRTRESELSSIMDAKEVDALPTNGRNYIGFTLTNSQIARDAAPSIGAIPTSGLNFGGVRARSNSINIDGADAGDYISGGTRTTYWVGESDVRKSQ